jgi:hypothetical protein
MHTWRITYRPYAGPRSPLIEDVDADDLELETNGCYVLTRYQLIVNQPRRVIALRVHPRDLAGRPIRLCDL